MKSSIVTPTALAKLQPTMQGKVRDIFDLGDSLPIVATDRLSAFDIVLPMRILDTLF